MTWPYDARDVTYAALSEAQSANFNKIQNEINNIAGLHTEIYSAAIPEEAAGTGQASWFGVGGGNERFGWTRDDVGTLLVPIEAREGSVVSRVDIKYEQTVGSAVWLFEFRRSDLFFDTPASAPSINVIAGSTPGPASTGWKVETYTGGSLPDTLGAESRWHLAIDAPNNGDRFAGVLITFDQLY